MTDFRQILINKINHEYLEFKSQIISQDKISIFDKARKIDIYNDIYGYLNSTVFPSYVTEYLCGIYPLAGAEIGLYVYTDENMEHSRLINSVVTGEDGLFSFTNIPYGNKYYVQEIKSPDGFILSDKKYPVDISSDGLVVDISMVNQPKKGSLDLTYNKPGITPTVSLGEAHTTTTNPTTGDNSSLLFFIITGLGALGISCIFARRKENV